MGKPQPSNNVVHHKMQVLNCQAHSFDKEGTRSGQRTTTILNHRNVTPFPLSRVENDRGTNEGIKRNGRCENGAALVGLRATGQNTKANMESKKTAEQIAEDRAKLSWWARNSHTKETRNGVEVDLYFGNTTQAWSKFSLVVPFQFRWFHKCSCNIHLTFLFVCGLTL